MLRERLPNHNLLLFDFSFLPTSMSGYSAPKVAAKQEGRTVWLPSYLHRVGEADIFFPTNFALLSELYRQAVPGQPRVAGNRQFFEEFGGEAVLQTQLQSGENPMLQLYDANTSFFLASTLEVTSTSTPQPQT